MTKINKKEGRKMFNNSQCKYYLLKIAQYLRCEYDVFGGLNTYQRGLKAAFLTQKLLGNILNSVKKYVTIPLGNLSRYVKNSYGMISKNALKMLGKKLNYIAYAH
jgi:hypothetical protein